MTAVISQMSLGGEGLMDSAEWLTAVLRVIQVAYASLLLAFRKEGAESRQRVQISCSDGRNLPVAHR